MGFADVTRADAVFPASRPTVLQRSIPAASSFAPLLFPDFLLSLFSFDDDVDHDHDAKVVDDDDDDNDDDKYEDREDDVNGRADGRDRGKGVAERGDGEGCTDAGRRGMQDIAAPRDTQRRNLHDGAGDVLQSRGPPTTKSLSFPCMNGPFSLACL